MLRVVYDNFILVVIAVAVALYLLIRLAKLRRVPMFTDGVPGLATALSTGLLGATLLVLGSVVLFPLAWLANRGRIVEWIGPAFLYIAGLVALGVLIVYAIWPARPRDRAGAVGRALAGFFLVLVTVIPIDGAISSALRREAEAERLQVEAERQKVLDAEVDAMDARSAGLSITIVVVDVRLEEPTPHGRVVSHIKLDITVRSTSEIQLRKSEENDPNQVMWLYPMYAPDIKVIGELGLPARLQAGFDATYRLDMPVVRSTIGQDPPTTGPWRASLILLGNDAAGERIVFRTEMSFTVPDKT